MKRFYARFRVVLFTAALGLASVNLFHWFNRHDEIAVNLPKVQSEPIFEIITKRNWNGFELYGHGCGGRNIYGGESSISAYQANDFRGVSASTSFHNRKKEIEREIEARIKDAVRILEITERSNLKRIVLENERNNEKWIDIITYDGGKGIDIISAASLELVLEFEQWQNLRNKSLNFE